MNFAINKGDKTEEFIDVLKEMYSIDQLKQLAKKNLYTCPYCQVPLRVKSGEDRGTYFAHPSNLACLESKQVEVAYRQYKKQIQRESLRHPVLVSMIKDELDTAAAGRDLVEIVEGYRVPRFTKHYPDLYVQIGSKEWAITVLTDMTEHESIEHSRNFKARHQYFIENGLVPLWLIDKANFTAETMKSSILMWEIEWLSSHTSKEDYTWKKEIATYTNREELFEVLGYTTSGIKANRVTEMKSIYYISLIEDKNYIRVFRFIDDLKESIYRGFLIGETSRVSFSQALHIENEAFMLRDPEQELSFRKNFKDTFLQAKMRKEEIEQRVLNEQEEQAKILQENREQENEDAVDPAVIEKVETYEVVSSQPDNSLSSSQKASASTAMTRQEKELDEHFRQLFYELNRGKVQNLTFHVSEKKYNEFLERMKTMRVEGASYILSSNQVWRSIILRWLEENYYLENWNISIQMMMGILKNAQVEFTENRDEILKVPIRDFLSIYQKLLKKDLKVKNNFIINS
ncbi:competence protein CoiA family protein [Planococcus donghaensis]|uniref:Competence protein CoiA-like N-terminal domain-containing protein n=1 Tax=Planococcus donghaensis TaxID=414778 RepID=A0A1C7EE84_9BACL|nr:competence protein CoiA family protein [Planococcus donghaensis]ANU22011.1 hypothetical protein BCM40_01065 [Planococcus donghaensis]